MSAPTLEELQQRMDACRVNGDYIAPAEPNTRYYVATPDGDVAALCPEHNALIDAAVAALPTHVAKLRAADALMEALEVGALLDARYYIGAYRKAGSP